MVLGEVSILPPTKTGNIVTLKFWLFMQLVVLFFILRVKMCVPVFPEGIVTEIGELGKLTSFTATKLGIVEVRLYLSGLFAVLV